MRKLVLTAAALAAATSAAFPAAAPGAKPVKATFDVVVEQTITGICPFPLEIRSAIRGHSLDFFDRDGRLLRATVHVTEQDTFSANGRTLVGEPFTFNVFFTFDESGEATAVLARGVAEKIRLPNGKLFLSAGVIDFLAQGVDFSFEVDQGTTGDVDAFCAALSP